ncbi:MAG TPA: hypothetical protein VMF58_14690 [Rhizomicrobium sp.]|nr:hypothetical protein [Rhizomicrobium sp.]
MKQSGFPTALLAAIAILLGEGHSYAAPEISARNNDLDNPIIVVVHADRAQYSLADNIEISVSLLNTGKSVIYVDRRMFWTGLSGSLALCFADEHGTRIPARAMSDAMMPPPPENDPSILVRLEPGFFYGTSIKLALKDFFTRPGRYSVRVAYQSMLPKKFVAPQLRDLPAQWSSSPTIMSEQTWIDIVQ